MPRMPRTLSALEADCRAAGLPVTGQRRAILEALLRRHDHPDAETVLAEVAREHPGVNRATIYRSLEALAAAGVVRRVAQASGRGRFDARSDPHHHLLCDGCGRIDDFDGPLPANISLAVAARRGFHVRETSIVVRGLCPDCRPRARSRTPRRKSR